MTCPNYFINYKKFKFSNIEIRNAEFHATINLILTNEKRQHKVHPAFYIHFIRCVHNAAMA